MESQTVENTLSTQEPPAASQAVPGRAVLAALLLAALLVVGLSTCEISDALVVGVASTSDAIVREQTALAGADALRRDAVKAQAVAEQGRANAEAARAALAAGLEPLTAAPLPNGSTVAWARGAVVGISGGPAGPVGGTGFAGTGFAVTYRDGATYIVTALHALGGARTTTVVTQQGNYLGQLVAVSSADAALLKIDALIPILFFRGVVSPGDPVSLVRYSDGLVEAATVARVSDKVLELSLPSRATGFWPGFSGGPVIAANGYVIGIMSSGGGISGEAVPRTATCDLLAC